MVGGAARWTKDERRRFLLRESADWGILAGVRNKQTQIPALVGTGLHGLARKM